MTDNINHDRVLSKVKKESLQLLHTKLFNIDTIAMLFVLMLQGPIMKKIFILILLWSAGIKTYDHREETDEIEEPENDIQLILSEEIIVASKKGQLKYK